jgi:hypothetical protein
VHIHNLHGGGITISHLQLDESDRRDHAKTQNRTSCPVQCLLFDAIVQKH